MKILYISYDGLMESLGYSQVFQYLRELAKRHSIHLITYEKATDWSNLEKRQALINEVDRAGIQWTALRYHKWPSLTATSFDVFVGLILSCILVRRNGIELVHARSYTPSLIALLVKLIFKIKYVFDMRGFWADEKADGGAWSRSGLKFRLAKYFEKRFLLAADRVVSLTNAAVDEMRSFTYLQGRIPSFSVIRTCADLSRFHPLRLPQRTEKIGSTKPIIVGSVGAVKQWYLFDELLSCFLILKGMHLNVKLLILNTGEHDFIRQRLDFHGIANDCVTLRSASFSDMPQQIALMDVAILMVRPSYSAMAKAPTKLGELLGCGIPCLANESLADMAPVLERDRVGVVLRKYGNEELRVALNQLIALAREPDISGRCRRVAEQYFSLASGVEEYDRIYAELSRK